MQIIKAYSTFNELEKTLDSDQKRQFLSDRAVKILKNDECWDFSNRITIQIK